MQQLHHNRIYSESIGWLAACLTALCVGIIASFVGVAVLLAQPDPARRFDPLPRTVTWQSIP